MLCSPLKPTDVSEEHIALLATCFQAGFLLGLYFEPEDEGDIFLRNVGWFSKDCMVYPGKQDYSEPPLWEPKNLQIVRKSGKCCLLDLQVLTAVAMEKQAH
jgi:hypothetical protein